MMRTPAFWSTDTALARALSPLGVLYEVASRRRKADPWRAPVPVICVGNVTAGGSGKTPVALALGKAALKKGIDVHFLSRGYGGSLKGPLRIDPARHAASEVGDEALLLARQAPAWIARDRVAAARLIAEAGGRLIVMDDGLQNPHLAKDLSLLVIDGGYGFGNGRLIPAGPLRERVAEAAGRADAAILIGADDKQACRALPSSLQVITTRIAPRAHNLAGRRVFAFAGIGRPDKFRRTLEESGANVVGWSPFGDHHAFKRRELERLVQEAARHRASLVTTEKDHVRLPPDLQPQVDVLAIDVVPDHPDAFARLIDGALG